MVFVILSDITIVVAAAVHDIASNSRNILDIISYLVHIYGVYKFLPDGNLLKWLNRLLPARLRVDNFKDWIKDNRFAYFIRSFDKGKYIFDNTLNCEQINVIPLQSYITNR